MKNEGPAQKSPLQRLAEELTRPPFNSWLGATALGIGDDGSVEIALPFRPELGLHPTEPIYHGGILAALIDIAGYAAVAIRHRGFNPTVSLHVDYLSPAIGQRLVARASLRKAGRTLSRVDVDVTAEGRLVAIGRGTFSMKETSA